MRIVSSPGPLLCGQYDRHPVSCPAQQWWTIIFNPTIAVMAVVTTTCPNLEYMKNSWQWSKWILNSQYCTDISAGHWDTLSRIFQSASHPATWYTACLEWPRRHWQHGAHDHGSTLEQILTTTDQWRDWPLIQWVEQWWSERTGDKRACHCQVTPRVPGHQSSVSLKHCYNWISQSAQLSVVTLIHSPPHTLILDNLDAAPASQVSLKQTSEMHLNFAKRLLI